MRPSALPHRSNIAIDLLSFFAVSVVRFFVLDGGLLSSDFVCC